MSIEVGVDLGTTFTAAAVARSGRFDMVELGNRANSVPSVVFAEPDGTLLVGEAALRRAASAPSRLAREYKRRIGDPTPISLGDRTESAEALTMAMLAWVVDVVAERMGERPTHVVVAYPANWGDYKRELLLGAAGPAGLEDLELSVVTEPEAAVVHYAAQARVPNGAQIAVYDLGGGTFDAAVVTKTASGAELMGQPEGIERLGGIDFDEAVFAHVVRALGADMPALDDPDDTLLAALSRLREECVRAKEALSSDTEVDIPVLLPGVHTQVRLTRAEFEGMIRAPLNASIAALRRAIASADISVEQLDAVLLVGGSSRIPLVAEMVGSALGRPVAVDAHPKHAVALGAAMLAAEAGAASAADTPMASGLAGVAGTTAVPEGHGLLAEPVTAPERTAPGGPPLPGDDLGANAPYVALEDAEEKRSGFPWALVGAGVLVLAAVVGGFIAFTRDSGDGTDVATGDQQTEVTPGADDGSDDGASTEAEQTPAEAPTATPEPAATATPAPSATPVPTPSPTPEPVCPPDAERCIEIASVEVDGDSLVVAWDANGFAPSVSAGHHAHFFWNVHEATSAGNNAADFGAEPGDWAAVEAQPWTSATDPKYALSARPADATEICVTVGTPTHGVDDPTLFDCVPIPT